MLHLMVKQNSGFTLIELLVVITIMSILTVITVSQFQSARQKARDVQRKSDLSSVTKALEMYYADYGRFPMVVGVGISSASWGGTFVDGSYVYMKIMPKENVSSWPTYCYITNGGATPTKFALLARMENEQDLEGGCANTNNKTAQVSSVACGGSDANVKYCYAIVSPNTSLGVDANGNPLLQ